MPWNDARFHSSMRGLSRRVRSKAIEIANALLKEGIEEGRAIPIAIVRARLWAARRGLPSRDDA